MEEQAKLIVKLQKELDEAYSIINSLKKDLEELNKKFDENAMENLDLYDKNIKMKTTIEKLRSTIIQKNQSFDEIIRYAGISRNAS